MVLLMISYISRSIYLDDSCFYILLFPVAVLVVIGALGILANVLFSFISVVKVVYRDYTMWNPDNIGCSSPAFISAFAYVTIEFILIGIVVIMCGFLIWYCRRQCCQ